MRTRRYEGVYAYEIISKLGRVMYSVMAASMQYWCSAVNHLHLTASFVHVDVAAHDEMSPRMIITSSPY